MNDQPASATSPDPAVLTLARELARTEARCALLARTRRHSLAGLVLASVAGFAAGAYVAVPATAQTTPAGAAATGTRDQLVAMLSAEDRARLLEFEQKVSWVSQYTRASPQFDAGAAIALLLSDMAKSMDAVPRMHAEMQAMNVKMNALPFLANEVAGMNAKMGVMTADMDSTLGRAGRMMPWGW